MLEHVKISSLQLGKILYMAVIPTALLTSPAIIYKFAQQDLWISPLWSWSGWIAVFVALWLWRMYPSENIVQIVERIGGKVIGKIVGTVYFFFLLYLNGIIVREYSEFVVGTFLRQTPVIVITAGMVFVCSLTVRGGVEIIGRFADLLLPFFITLFVLDMIPIIPELSLSEMFPFMKDGIKPSMEGAYTLQIWYSEMMIASFFLPFVHDPKKAKKNILFCLLAIIFTLMITNFVILLLLGNLIDGYTYPLLVLARYINIADFITHLESVYMAIWVVGAFVKICVFFYVAVLIAAQTFEMSDYRPIVNPVGLFIVLFSMWVAYNVQELSYMIETSMPLVMMTMFVVLPSLLLLMAYIKKRISK